MAKGYAKDQPQGFSNRIEKVAIIGAGGQQGKYITDALLKKGNFVVTAITRPKSTSKLPEGVNVARVNYFSDDDKALVEALRGQQALLVTMAIMAPRDTISRLVRAAAKAGVPCIQPNWFGHDAANDLLCYDSFLGESRDSIVAEIESLGVILPTALLQLLHMAIVLSLKGLPEDETDKSATFSQFRNGGVYISSFRITQRVTKTTDTSWTITHESAEQRWKDAHAQVLQGNFAAFTKNMYSRMFFNNGDGDYESRWGLDNTTLDLSAEDLDEYTAIAIRMKLNGGVANHSHQGVVVLLVIL